MLNEILKKYWNAETNSYQINSHQAISNLLEKEIQIVLAANEEVKQYETYTDWFYTDQQKVVTGMVVAAWIDLDDKLTLECIKVEKVGA